MPVVFTVAALAKPTRKTSSPVLSPKSEEDSDEPVLADRAGFSPDATVFAGPGKTDRELRTALLAGIFAINVESLGEMRRLEGLATETGRVARIALRINPSGAVKGAHMRMGGGAHQFGLDEELLSQAIQTVRGMAHVRLVGLHVYAGTQMFDVPALLEHIERVAGLAGRMADGLGRPLEMIDFGGGFGVPYTRDAPAFDLPSFSTGWRATIARCRADSRLARARFMVELGRYLVAEAGTYVTRVVDVKESLGRVFVITDGGMNHHMAATGNFGQVFKKPYPMSVLGKQRPEPARQGEEEAASPLDGRITVAGPCCTPMDILGQDIHLPLPAVGDMIAVHASGAYGYSASSLGFLSHPTPAEVLLWDGGVHVLREPGTPEQVLRGQRGLDSL